jgi:RluA family pseudouridine synthase
MRYEWVVSFRDDDKSLLAFLQGRLEDKGYSLRKIKGWIDAGFCSLRGRPERFSRTKVTSGAKVCLLIPQVVKYELQILYEDDDLLLLNKPAKVTCDERLVLQLARMDKKIQLVHRLDKDTTGCLLCAKSEEVKDYFIEQFRAQHVHKRYQAICDGVIAEETGTIANYLGAIFRYDGHVKWGPVSKDGHLAVTDWQVLARSKNATRLTLYPKTGRTHQLRVHTSSMGHPILGDYTYSERFRCPYKPSRVLLHAERIAFCHPKTGEMLHKSAVLPDDFQQCVKELF